MPKRRGAIDFPKVKDAAAIEQVLDRYGVALKRSGKQLTACCPIHKGSNPRAFVVDPKKNVWRCFADCDRGGTVIDLVAEMEHVSANEAAFMIAQWFGIDPERPDQRRTEMANPSTMPSHKVYVVEGEGDDAFWTRVGSAWAHKDSKGFNVQLSALPTNGRIVLREPNDEEADAKATKSTKRR